MRLCRAESDSRNSFPLRKCTRGNFRQLLRSFFRENLPANLKKECQFIPYVSAYFPDMSDEQVENLAEERRQRLLENRKGPVNKQHFEHYRMNAIKTAFKSLPSRLPPEVVQCGDKTQEPTKTAPAKAPVKKIIAKKLTGKKAKRKRFPDCNLDTKSALKELIWCELGESIPGKNADSIDTCLKFLSTVPYFSNLSREQLCFEANKRHEWLKGRCLLVCMD